LKAEQVSKMWKDACAIGDLATEIQALLQAARKENNALSVQDRQDRISPKFQVKGSS
jgi:hypothetical protein